MSIQATEGVPGLYSTTYNAVAPTTTTSNGAQPATPSSTSDKDLFLSLLVAQMKYQDPMNPADSSAFLTQTATFTQVEKLQQVVDQSSALLSAQNAFGASGLVGRNVSWSDASGTTQTGAVNGVTFSADGPLLDVDGTEVPLASILSVVASPRTDSSTTGATGTDAETA